MIVGWVTGNIFETDCNHIVFAVNTEGFNDSGFAGQVSRRFWPELAHVGSKKLGEILSLKKEGKTFYAIVCHSLKDGWAETPRILEERLNSLDIPESEPIASVKIGGGFVGQVSGADLSAIYDAMDRCKKRIVLYTR